SSPSSSSRKISSGSRGWSASPTFSESRGTNRRAMRASSRGTLTLTRVLSPSTTRTRRNRLRRRPPAAAAPLPSSKASSSLTASCAEILPSSTMRKICSRSSPMASILLFARLPFLVRAHHDGAVRGPRPHRQLQPLFGETGRFGPQAVTPAGPAVDAGQRCPHAPVGRFQIQAIAHVAAGGQDHPDPPVAGAQAPLDGGPGAGAGPLKPALDGPVGGGAPGPEDRTGKPDAAVGGAGLQFLRLDAAEADAAVGGGQLGPAQPHVPAAHRPVGRLAV